MLKYCFFYMTRFNGSILGNKHFQMKKLMFGFFFNVKLANEKFSKLCNSILSFINVVFKNNAFKE